MKSSRAAIRYAKALIQESIEVDSLESMYSDMQVVLNTFQENDNLKFLVESRVVKNSLKLSTLKLIFKKIINTTSGIDPPQKRCWVKLELCGQQYIA